MRKGDWARPVRMAGTERRFRVWRDPVVTSIWRWECTLCQPPACGYRATCDAWYRIMTISLPRHMSVKRCHHAWVKRAERVLGVVGA